MKYIFSLTFVLLLTNGFSQYGVRPLYFQPIKELRDKFLPTGSLEFSIAESFTESKFRTVNSFSAFWLRPVADTLRVYTYEDNKVLPGTETNISFFSFNWFCGVDWAPVELGRFYPYVGIDFNTSIYHSRYDRTIEELSNESVSEMGVYLGYRVKLGLEYQYTDRLAFLLQLNRQGWMDITSEFDGGGIDAGLGVRLFF